MKCLLIGPEEYRGGEATYIDSLISCPPEKIEYAPMRFGEPKNQIRKVNLLQFSLELGFLFAMLKGITATTGVPVRFVTSKLKGFDLIHNHIFPISFLGRPHPPLILSTSMSTITTPLYLLGWDTAKLSRSLLIEKLLYRLFDVHDHNVNFHDVTKLITWSEYSKNFFLRLGLPEEKIEVVPPGLPRPSKVTGGMREDGLTIVFVGTDYQRKGGELLLRAFKQLKKRHKRMRLVMVTRPPQNLRIQTEDTFVGPVDRRKLYDKIYPFADIFVLPSNFEGFPIAIIEAMSFGLPVIATNIFGIPEIVLHEKTGFLTKPGDLDSLTQYIELLVEDGDMRKKMGREALGRFDEKFLVDKTNERLRMVYDEAIGR